MPGWFWGRCGCCWEAFYDAKRSFDVGVRLVGIGTIVYGLWDLMYAMLFYADYFRNPDSSFRFYMVAGWGSVAIGLILVRSASTFVNFAYGPLVVENENNLAADETVGSE